MTERIHALSALEGLTGNVDGTEMPPLPGVPRPPQPPRLRSQASPDQVRALADRLFEHFDPTAPGANVLRLRRELPRVYTKSIHGRTHAALFQVMAGGARLYLQGAAVGVGATMLATDTSRSFNVRAKDRGLPQRVVYLNVWHGMASEKDLLEALCRSVRAPLSLSERRLRSPSSIGERIVTATQLLNVNAIVLDHVHNASERARGVVADLLRITDPSYHVSLDVDLEPIPHGRLGVVIVDHADPEALFRNHVDVLALLQGNHITLNPYRSVEELAEAVRQADVGLHDLDLADHEDAEFTERLLAATDGLIVNVMGVLQTVDLVSVANQNWRPDCAVLGAALGHYRKMTKLLAGKGRDGQTYFQTVPTPSARPLSQTRAGTPRKARKGAKTKLRQKREARGEAEAEKKQMLRRGFSTLPRPSSDDE